MKKRIITINPQEFLTEFYRKTKHINGSVQSEMGKSYHTISHFHSSQSQKYGQRKFKPSNHYNNLIHDKNEKELVTDDTNINDIQKTIIRETTTHTNHTSSNISNNQTNKITPLLYGNFHMKREMLLLEILNYQKEKKELMNRKSSQGSNGKKIEILVSDIKKYKKMADNCKHTFIELSYQINTLKKKINKVK